MITVDKANELASEYFRYRDTISGKIYRIEDDIYPEFVNYGNVKYAIEILEENDSIYVDLCIGDESIDVKSHDEIIPGNLSFMIWALVNGVDRKGE